VKLCVGWRFSGLVMNLLLDIFDSGFVS
jgi:hypothetical protein